MKSIIDILALIVLATVGFVTWADTPFGRISQGKEPLKSNAVIEKNITIETPLPESRAFGYVNVRGQARVFENQLNIRLRDAILGETLMEDSVMALAPEVGTFGPWQYELNLNSLMEGKHLLIEAFNYSAKDGSIENLVSVPVIVWRTPGL